MIQRPSILVDLLLGHEPRLRLTLLRTLTAGGVYLVCLLLQAHSVWAEYVPLQEATGVFVFVLLGQMGFYGVLRTGWTLSLRDPALTMPQMVFALSALALAYRVNPHVRGAVLIVVPLVLIFGAFTLTPSRCRALGWAAVALFGSAMAWGASHDARQIDTTIEWIHFFFVATVLPTISLLAGQLSQWRSDLQVQKRELREALDRLRLLATHDELTGLPNRRHVQEWVRQAPARDAYATRSACVALIDLDHFKRINDLWGHAVGDSVLRIFAREAVRLLRSRDMLARWGGEEFVLVMPDTSCTEARAVLARLREGLARPDVWAECPQARATFSAGLSVQTATQTFEEAMRLADTALYAAKDAGRDRVVAAID
ncbi:MAG: GGDEF domain-containing protein [Burkholderiales bacterium]|nr:GGDEF domain-containing protein [Burkholderiales bacterium]